MKNRRRSEIIVFSEKSDLRGSVTQKYVIEMTIIWHQHAHAKYGGHQMVFKSKILGHCLRVQYVHQRVQPPAKKKKKTKNRKTIPRSQFETGRISPVSPDGLHIWKRPVSLAILKFANSGICLPVHSSVFSHLRQLLLGNSSRPHVHIRFCGKTIFSVQ